MKEESKVGKGSCELGEAELARVRHGEAAAGPGGVGIFFLLCVTLNSVLKKTSVQPVRRFCA